MANSHFESPHEVEKRRINEAQSLSQHDHGDIITNLPPEYSKMVLGLFPHGSLKDSNGKVIPNEHLTGKSVALYFAQDGNPKCNSFLPFLLRYYKSINESGLKQKIEIIFVSLDATEDKFLKHKAKMPWLYIELSDPLTEVIKEHFCVKNHYSHGMGGRRSKPPALIVVQSDGTMFQNLPICSGREEGRRGLLRWDWRSSRYEHQLDHKA